MTVTLPERTQPDYWNGVNDANARFFGHGSSTTPKSMGSTANQNAIGHWFDSTATTGDTRGMYLRQYFSGTGGSGEAARIFGTVNGVTAATGGTVNGAHITLSLSGAAAAISGASNAIRATYGIGTGVTSPGGTNACIQLDSDIASGVTQAAKTFYLRCTNSGAVAMGKFLEMPNAANGTIFAAHGTDAMTHSIKCETADGTAFYIMCTTTVSNRS
jgi:hypothetical protein